jgi:PEP-CTERM motif
LTIRLASKALPKSCVARLIPMLLVGVLFLSVSPGALADTLTTYGITFTLTPGYTTLPASGSFTYDSTNPQFSNFLVSWAGNTFDLTAGANSPTVTGSGCTGEASTPSFGFTLMSQSASGCSSPIFYYWSGIFEADEYSEFAFGLGNSNTGYSEDYFSNSIRASFSGSEPVGTGTWSISPTSTVTTPEPSVFLLLGIGIFALRGIRRGLRVA